MSNAGFPGVREKIAKSVQAESGVSLTGENIVMTVGAAGGLNVVFKSNNPTGIIYSEECLKSMAAIIESKEKETSYMITLLV